jgi:hypothetical protein
MWHQPYLLSYCRLIQSQHHFCRLWLWNEENLELKIGSIPLLKVITCLSLLGTGSGERGFSTSQFCWNWWCLRISWVSFMSISNCHFHAASPYTIRNQLGSWRALLAEISLSRLINILSSYWVLRASPDVLSIWPWTLKLDEENSKHAGLSQHNGFGPAFLHFCRGW